MSCFDHTIMLKNDGTLWGCGPIGGQLGLGDTNGIYTFTEITENADDVKSVYCGYGHTIILKNDGTLWGCGSNDCGQLGLGDTISKNTFTQITTNTNDIKSIYCGYRNTFLLKKDGTLWGCGLNDYGQLGLGDNTNRTTFIQITTNTNDIKSVYCGSAYTLILKKDSTLWGCGTNISGRLGSGSSLTFKQIINDVKLVTCGDEHALILKNDGTLWSTGSNRHGQLGINSITGTTTYTQITTNVDNIKSIYCGKYYNIILKNDDTLWGCGRNDYGQLGLGDTNNRKTFTQITTNVDDIKEIYCGESYVLILKNDNTLWGCGNNGGGQLGLGNIINTVKTFTEITINTDDIRCLANEDTPAIIKVYDLNTGLIETLDTNNFRNIPVNKFEKIKVLYTNPAGTYINCLVSFDQKQTWKTFNGTSWSTISDTSSNNILLNGMDVSKINKLDKNKLIQGGFTGDIDFKIAMKTNDNTVTPSITKIYILYC